MKKQVKNNNVTLRMSDEMVYKIKVMAARQNRNFSNMVEALIIIGINNHPTTNSTTSMIPLSENRNR